MNYTVGANTFSNADVSLSLGVGVSGNWGGIFSPRTWNGTIHYTMLPSVLNNDSDPENDPLTAVWDSGPGNGALDLNLDGSFLYTPTMDFCGTDNFTYHANDGLEDSSSATVTLTITCVNDAPIVNEDGYSTTEDTTLNIAASGVLTNDTDVDGDSLTAVLDTNVTTGTLNLNNNGSFTYTPPANWFGVTTFSYHANDGQANSNTAVVTLTVTAVNDAPVANDDGYSVMEDATLNIAPSGVLTNDTDVEGDGLTAVLDTNVTSGTLTFNSDGSLTYVPDANFCGTDSFTYHANDGSANSNSSATVTLTVTCVNDAPNANDDTAATDEDTAVNITVLSNDVDIDGDGLTVTAVSTPNLGSTGTDGTTVTYTPENLVAGYTAVFTYTISDGGLTDTATVTVTVSADNDAPTAVDDLYSVLEDSSNNTLMVMTNDSDGDGDDTLSLLAVGTPDQGGTAVISGSDILYTPIADFTGTETFTYTIQDLGGLTDTATVTISVDNVNDAPTAVDDSYTINEDNSSALTVLDNDSDIDVGDSLSLSAVSSPVNGTAVLSGTTILYTPAPDFFGSDTFTYTIQDLGGLMDTATVSVTIEAVNDAPTAVDDSYTVSEDSSDNAFTVLDNDSDIDVGDSLNISDVSSPVNGTAVLSGTTIFYTPTPDFFGTDTFTYTITDGTATSTATVTVIVEDVPDETGFTIYLPFLSKP
jgi:VCBS repeat-containing protein